jgi:hypothetical protein
MKTTIHKRAVETTYKLKSDSSRKFLSLVEKNFHTFPFSLSSFETGEDIQTTKEIVIKIKSGCQKNSKVGSS